MAGGWTSNDKSQVAERSMMEQIVTDALSI